MVLPHLKKSWHDEDNAARDNEGNQKEGEIEEEIRRQHQDECFPNGIRRQGNVEREMNCCSVICDGPTTVRVKGLYCKL